MAEDKKSVDPTLAGFYEAMEEDHVEKITDEMLAGLSGDSSNNESFEVESENEDAEDRPWRPSHVVFGKSTIKQGQIEAMKGKYFHDISIVRAGGESNVPLPEADAAISCKKRVLSEVALTKAAIASANVGGTGGGFGVSSPPREVPAPSCAGVLDGI